MWTPDGCGRGGVATDIRSRGGRAEGCEDISDLSVGWEDLGMVRPWGVASTGAIVPEAPPGGAVWTLWRSNGTLETDGMRIRPPRRT